MSAKVTKTAETEPAVDVEAIEAMIKAAGAGGDKVEHFTAQERASLGKAARAVAPLESHAEWTPSEYRVDPIELLQQQAETRVPELIPIRHGRMMATPFTFYRGAAIVMASDLASTPRTGLRVQACGDAHLVNFGVFASPERDLMFDLNDFDETIPGPWEWDVKRLAASFVVAARDLGFDDAARRTAVLTTVRTYREAMRSFAAMKNLEVWYAKLDVATIIRQLNQQADKAMAKRVEGQMAKVKGKDNLRAFAKLTTTVEGEPRIVSDPPLIVPIVDVIQGVDREELMDALRGMFRSYRRTLQRDRRRLLEGYRLVDVARKVVGVGSVGTRTWVALALGRDDQDPLFLQFKEAEESVLSPFVGRSPFKNQGQRVVEGQRLMQAASDIFLGWERTLGVDGVNHDYYIRQLWDSKGSADIATMLPRGLEAYGQICGWTLARAHARSGDRVAIGSYLGKKDVFDQAIAAFAEAYADQNEVDHKAMVDAVKSGRIAAEEGV
jgi:uncharacterized protein (DUF2252 family)